MPAYVAKVVKKKDYHIDEIKREFELSDEYAEKILTDPRYHIVSMRDDIGVNKDEEVQMAVRVFKEQPKTNSIGLYYSWVNPDFRGRNINSVMLNKIEEWARERGYKTLVAHTRQNNTSSQRSLEKDGFVMSQNLGIYKDTNGLKFQFIKQLDESTNFKSLFDIDEEIIMVKELV